MQDENVINPIPIAAGDCGGVNATHNYQSDNKTTIYPNPTNGIIKVTNISRKGTYFPSDIGGRIIDDGEVETDSAEIDLLSFPKGFYTLHLHTGNTSETFKIVKL